MQPESQPAAEAAPKPPAKSPWSFGTREMVMAAIFGAMVIVLGITGLAVIPVPNLSGGATIYHLPVILGGIIGGPIVGMITGLVMGLLLLAQFPAFGPIVMLPGRILIGLVAWAVYYGMRKANSPSWLSAAIAGAAGSLTNTVVTVGLAVLLVPNLFPAAAIPTVIPQALAEAVIAAILTPIIVVAVEAAMKARK